MYMKRKTVGGLVLMLVGVGIIVYAFLLWNSNFQFSKATNPNFVINSMVVSVVYIILTIIGILVFIGGGLVINKDKALQIIKKLNENLANKAT
ncbi:MAG: hypothetical protein ACP5UH_02865 [Candidatus Micrarchaeia archaeon]